MAPKRQNRLVRIFVSSTFQDMERERDALQMYVVPRLQSWCQNQGWQFEMVDLRWGISEEASQANRTMSICLEELATCQNLSPKPHLLLLLGERYGWIPLPEKLTLDEVNNILKTADENEKIVFGKVYQIEKNNYPASYELQANPGMAEEEQLRHLMMRYCQKNNDELFYSKHLISATEQEIQQGLLTHTDLFDQVVTYERTLTDIPENIKDRYVDSAHTAELNLLYKKVNAAVPPHNIVRSEVRYAEYNNSGYIDWFAAEIESRLKLLIEAEMTAYPIDDFYEEMQNQYQLLTSAAENYQIRGDEINSILNIISTTPNGICVIQGSSGDGLTTMAAHICRKLETCASKLIFRFVGIGRLSSSGLLLLRSLLKEVDVSYSDSDTVFDLISKWRVYIEGDHQDTIIIIDGIERLDTNDWFRYYQWLPTCLPKGVHILLTSSIVETSKLAQHHPTIFALPTLDEKNFIDAFISDLHSINRQLTSSQLEMVKSAYSTLKSPLARKPLVAITSHWKENDFADLHIDSIQGLIDAYLNGLISAQYHDSRFIGLALGLLCFCRHGVSEQEMLEIIATDDEFFSQLQEKSHHRIVESGRPRVPFVFWSRLHHDMAFLLVMRQNKNCITYVFANKVVELCVERWIDWHYPTLRHQVLELACNYFDNRDDSRTYEELPYLLNHLGNAERQDAFIVSDQLLMGKCVADMAEDLIADYDMYLKKHSGGTAANIVFERLVFLRKNFHAIQKYAKYGNDIIVSLMENESLQANKHHWEGLAYPTIHFPETILAVAANANHIVICQSPASGTSDTYMECFLIDRNNRETIAFALLPFGWGRCTPDEAVLSDDSHKFLVYSKSEEYYILWHIDTGQIEYKDVEELTHMAMMPNGDIYYLANNKMKTTNDVTVFSFDDYGKFYSSFPIRLCPDPKCNTIYILDRDYSVYYAYHIDSQQTEIIHIDNAKIANVIGYDCLSASLIYNEEEGSCICRYLLRENTTDPFTITPQRRTPSAALVAGQWIVFIENKRINCININTGKSCVSDESCKGKRICSIGSSSDFFTLGCYELKEWTIEN